MSAGVAHAGNQFLVTVANRAGNTIYDLSETANGALITGATEINTDGATHGSFDSVVWVPNAATGSLDLLVADASKGQILRYAGPDYGKSAVVYSHATTPKGPAQPTDLSVDAAGNLYVASAGQPPSLWVLPVNTKGAYGAPVLIDETFHGARTCNIAETLVAVTTTPLWNRGDLLVLINDSFDARVIVYSQQSIAGVLAAPTKPLTGPTSTALPFAAFLTDLAVPMGMAEWPADSTHGDSLLLTTVDGRILRFEATTSAFTANFASGLGLGLGRIKTATYANSPYAFVIQDGSSAGKILEFGAPPAHGSNAPLASFSKGLTSPAGLAVTNTDAVPVSACVNNTCSLLGGGLTLDITPGMEPLTGSIVAQSCIVPTDPRVTFPGGTWSCNGAQTLNVANYCPGFPTTILPGSLCGHAGASGAGLVVIKTTALGVDPVDNNALIRATSAINVLLPGSTDLKCSPPGAFAWAPRSDLTGVEGTIPEDALAPYFIELTGLCDDSGVDERGVSMYAVGVALNTAVSALPTGLPGYVTAKYTNLDATVSTASITSGTAAALKACITTSQNDFNSGVSGAANGFSCAAYQLAQCDTFVRSNLSSFSSNLTPAGGNPNPAGDIDGRLANLYLTINTRVAGNAVNTTWPANNIPSCLALNASSASVIAGSAVTLTWSAVGVPSGGQCVLDLNGSSSHVANSGSVSPVLKTIGTYTAVLQCPSEGGAPSSLASTTVTVTPPPPPKITSFSANPTTVVAGTTSTVTLAWTTANEPAGATCAVSGTNGTTRGSLPVNGSVSSGPLLSIGTYTATLTCTGAASATTTVSVTPPPPPPAIVSFTASPATVTAGGTTTLTWVTSQEPATATACTLTSPNSEFTGGSYGTNAGGSVTTGPLTSTLSVTLHCPGANGSTLVQTLSVPVTPGVPPVITSFTASLTSVADGGSALLSWSATGVPFGSTCTLSATDGTFTMPNMSEAATGSASTGALGTGAATSQYTATLTCPGTGGASASKTVTLPVLTNIAINSPAAYPTSPATALALSSTGLLYLANQGAAQILVYGPGGNGQFVQMPDSTITLTGTNEPTPTALAFDTAGNLYVADSANNQVLVFSTTGGNAVPINGATISLPVFSPGMPSGSPSALAIDSSGTVYVAENGDSAFIQLYSYPSGLSNGPTAGATVSSDTVGIYGGIGALGFDGNNVVAVINYYLGSETSAEQISSFTPASFSSSSLTPIQSTPYAGNSPSGIAFAGGNYYVSDSFNGAVTAYTPGTPNGGGATPPAGSQTSFALNGYPPLALTAAGGIAIDASGTVYASDLNDNTVDAYSGIGTYQYAFLPIVTLSFASYPQLIWNNVPYYQSEYPPAPGTYCTLTTTDEINNVSSSQVAASGNIANASNIVSATLVCPGATASATPDEE
jgi:sugar lactone lactonase YvrE